jgi:hypothetical protein
MAEAFPRLRLLDEGFSVFVTSDHGNVAAVGMGEPKQGVLVESPGNRARIYDSPLFLSEAQAEYDHSSPWPSIGLPPKRHTLLPKGLRGFAQRSGWRRRSGLAAALSGGGKRREPLRIGRGVLSPATEQRRMHGSVIAYPRHAADRIMLDAAADRM